MSKIYFNHTHFIGNMLQSILSGQVITNSMALPTHLATALLQQHVNSVLAAQSISGTIFNFVFFFNLQITSYHLI